MWVIIVAIFGKYIDHRCPGGKRRDSQSVLGSSGVLSLSENQSWNPGPNIHFFNSLIQYWASANVSGTILDSVNTLNSKTQLLPSRSLQDSGRFIQICEALNQSSCFHLYKAAKGSILFVFVFYWHIIDAFVELEKTLESPLDCKEIQAVHPKGNQS